MYTWWIQRFDNRMKLSLKLIYILKCLGRSVLCRVFSTLSKGCNLISKLPANITRPRMEKSHLERTHSWAVTPNDWNQGSTHLHTHQGVDRHIEIHFKTLIVLKRFEKYMDLSTWFMLVCVTDIAWLMSVTNWAYFPVWTVKTLQHTATHCNTLQHAAERFSTLQFGEDTQKEPCKMWVLW